MQILLCSVVRRHESAQAAYNVSKWLDDGHRIAVLDLHRSTRNGRPVQHSLPTWAEKSQECSLLVDEHGIYLATK